MARSVEFASSVGEAIFLRPIKGFELQKCYNTYTTLPVVVPYTNKFTPANKEENLVH